MIRPKRTICSSFFLLPMGKIRCADFSSSQFSNMTTTILTKHRPFMTHLLVLSTNLEIFWTTKILQRGSPVRCSNNFLALSHNWILRIKKPPPLHKTISTIVCLRMSVVSFFDKRTLLLLAISKNLKIAHKKYTSYRALQSHSWH